MIEIKIQKKQGAYDIRIKGHAGYEEKGKDIMCASASTLLYTLSENIKGNPCVIDYAEEFKSGNSRIFFTFSGTREIPSITTTIERGFVMLAREYPEYFSVDFER
jgi:hypothetical protein